MVCFKYFLNNLKINPITNLLNMADKIEADLTIMPNDRFKKVKQKQKKKKKKLKLKKRKLNHNLKLKQMFLIHLDKLIYFY